MERLVEFNWQDLVDITGHALAALRIARSNCRDPAVSALHVVVDVLLRASTMITPTTEGALIAPPRLPRSEQPALSLVEHVTCLAKGIWTLFACKKVDRQQETDDLSERDGHPRAPRAPLEVPQLEEPTLITQKTRNRYPNILEHRSCSPKVKEIQETSGLSKRDSRKAAKSSPLGIILDGSDCVANNRHVSYPSPPPAAHCQGLSGGIPFATPDSNKSISPSIGQKRITSRTTTTTKVITTEKDKEVLVSRPRGDRITIEKEISSPEAIQSQSQPSDNQRRNSEENHSQGHPTAQSQSTARQTASEVNLTDWFGQVRATLLSERSNN